MRLILENVDEITETLVQRVDEFVKERNSVNMGKVKSVMEAMLTQSSDDELKVGNIVEFYDGKGGKIRGEITQKYTAVPSYEVWNSDGKFNVSRRQIIAVMVPRCLGKM